MKNRFQRNILITGGGPIAYLLASLLAQQGNALQLLSPPASTTKASQHIVALSDGSARILQSIGCWPLHKANPIEIIQVSQQGAWGNTRLLAEEQQLQALGWVINIQDLHDQLVQTFQQWTKRHPDTCRQYTDAHFTEQLSEHAIHLTSAEGNTYTGDFLVTADGKTDGQRKHYQQTAITGIVRAHHAEHMTAYERFTDHGPIALLPYNFQPDTKLKQYALVWVDHCEQQNIRMQSSSHTQNLLSVLQKEFGYRAGCFQDLEIQSCIPLQRMARLHLTAPRKIWMGNSAQTLHPVAGQGLNLGMRDAYSLHQILQNTAPETSVQTLLLAYQQARHTDRSRLLSLTDRLATGILSNRFLNRFAMGIGLNFLDVCPIAKSIFTDHMLYGYR